MAWHRFGQLVLASAIASLGLSGPPAIAQEVVKIGAPLALTGALADSGKKQKLGFDLWLERINKAGGITVGGKKLKVELVTYDYQTDGKRAGELAEKLINDDKVSFMIAPFGSGHTKITAAVAERYGVPIVAVASSEAVHDQGFKHLFGTLAPSSGLVDAMLTKFKATKPDLNSIAILGREDVFPKLMADLMKGAAEKAGIKVVYSGTYAIGSVDHSAALTAMRQVRPQLDLHYRIFAGPDIGAQADGGSRPESADHHHDHRPRLQGIHRRARTAGGERDQRILVALGDAVQER